MREALEIEAQPPQALPAAGLAAAAPAAFYGNVIICHHFPARKAGKTRPRAHRMRRDAAFCRRFAVFCAPNATQMRIAAIAEIHHDKDRCGLYS